MCLSLTSPYYELLNNELVCNPVFVLSCCLVVFVWGSEVCVCVLGGMIIYGQMDENEFLDRLLLVWGMVEG